MKDNALLVALYIRVSTEEQIEGYSLDAQREALLEYCRMNGLKAHKVYVDAGRSGKSIEGRPAIRELLDDAQDENFKQVACLRLNRLSRSLSDLLYIVELLDRHGIALRSLTEDLQTDTPMGKFALQMIGSVAEHERRQIGQNVRLGMQRRNRLGKWNGGNQVLGYQWITHTIDPRLSYCEVIASEAEVVNYIYRLYASGYGLKAIVNRLNSSGRRTKRGKAFHSATVKGILTNANYIGKITYTNENGKRITVDGEQTPIVPTELWEEVQQRLSERSCPVNKQISRPFPLSGLLKCPKCESSMIPTHVVRNRKNGARAINYYYVCSRYNSGGSAVCQPNHIGADVAEEWVNEQVMYFLAHPFIAERLTEEIKQRRDNKLLPLRQRLERIEANLASLQSRSLRCYELFEDGHIDIKELGERLEVIRSETSHFEDDRQQLARLISQQPDLDMPEDKIRKMLDNFRPLLQSASPEQHKKLYRGLIEKIVVPQNRDIAKAIIKGTATLLNINIPPNLQRGTDKHEPTG
ncbi:recombinase family protein [Paenibacillus timonensis]|uniref:recombinase family protein n=1 Tax=Paenibacillus timonensis TaxID=225915 RepID=UPI003F94655A